MKSHVEKTFSVLFIAVIAFGTFLIYTETVLACLCVGKPPAAQALEQAAAVFTGQVIKIKEVEIEVGGEIVRQNRATFEVAKSWKGIMNETIAVHTGFGVGDCGYEFAKDESYLVYAFGGDFLGKDLLHTNICSRTNILADAQEDLKVLRALPVSPRGGLTTTWARIKFYGR